MSKDNIIKEALDKLKVHILQTREMELQGYGEYCKANNQIHECRKALETLLSPSNQGIISELEEAESDLIIATGDFLYDAGFRDGIKVIKQLLMESCL